jgi:branched-chain amino acid transport system substrate-binding protein
LRRRSWASAFALLACLPLTACAGAGITGASRVTVYVSVPLRGPTGADGRDVVDGARMALAAAGGKAGGLAVRARYLDDTAAGPGGARWSSATVGANARRATEDTSAVAYIGDFESGATRTSEPITNAAHLLQVSPASGAVDLVRPFLGSEELPAVEDEGGERTFGRVIPDDQAQAAAAAAWARELKAKRVELVADGSPFGRTMATAFREALRGVRVTRAEPQLLYYAGLAGDEPARARDFRGRVMGSDALLEPFRAGAPAVAGLATAAAQPPSRLPPSGRRFAAAFARRYGRATGPYAGYGYEAMAVVLDSIRRAGDSGTERQAVVDAFFATRGRRSVLGTYSIDAVGDTTLDRLAGYRLAPGGRATPVASLPAR